MKGDTIGRLLKLQKCDARCDRIEKQLRRIPLEIADYDRQIEKEEKEIQAAGTTIDELEVRRRDFDREVVRAEEQVARYKNQQLMVKKNEEYQALQHEIDATVAKISDLEDDELALLLEIDDSRVAAKSEEKEKRQRIEQLQRVIVQRKGHETEFQGELEEAQAATEKARGELDEASLRLYQYVRSQTKRFPLVVSIVDHMCTGCHIKVPTDIEVATKKDSGLTRCHNCGRILYFKTAKLA